MLKLSGLTLCLPGVYGVLRSVYYLSKVEERPLYTDMAIITVFNTICCYTPILFMNLYKDTCITEQKLRGLPLPSEIPLWFLYNRKCKWE